MTPFLNLKDFDFHLPDSLIAQKPLPDRDQSKLMILDRNSGSIKHEIFKNLPHYIAPQSLMVFNNTRVIPALLIVSRELVISMLRQYVIEKKVKEDLKVSFIGKSKTTIQLIAIGMLILAQEVNDIWLLSIIAIWFAAIFSLYSLFTYVSEWFKSYLN